MFVRVIGEIIKKAQQKDAGNSAATIRQCVVVLHNTKSLVLPTIFLRCPDPDKFIDPRPTLCEAWLMALGALAKMARDGHINDDAETRQLLVETCAACLTIPLYPVLSKSRDERCQSHFMGLEGPQTLALNEFLTLYFELGPAMLKLVANLLLERVPVDVQGASQYSADSTSHGVALVGAALFRAAEGAFPPWSIESLPEIYASLYVAFGKDANAFFQMFQQSMDIRLVSGFGAVEAGHLVCLENQKNTEKQTFLKAIPAQIAVDKSASWKSLKVSIKRVTGGKKTGTDFTQKPAPTNWEFDRV